MAGIRGKSVKALTLDVAEGYVTVNPIFLKSIEPDVLRELFHELTKTQAEIRNERFPTNDIAAIRARNLRLQRLYSAHMIIRNFARERRISLLTQT